MRIDLVLKYLCLIKSRSIAKNLCEQGRVLVGGHPARSSATVRVGDRVTVHFAHHALTVWIDAVPEKQLSKSSALTYYHAVETPDAERLEDSADPLEDL
jgi:ribosomal 50S subunit-recycling heat shock protein